MSEGAEGTMGKKLLTLLCVTSTSAWLGGCASQSEEPDCEADPCGGSAASPQGDASQDQSPDEDAGQATAVPDAAQPADDAATDTGPAEDPDQPLLTQGAWGPAARITMIEFPDSPETARADGCNVIGAQKGSGLANLVLLGGGFDSFLQPDANGAIALVLLLQTAGWQEGQRPSELETVDLRFYEGALEADGRFSISPLSFEEGPSEAVSLEFPASPVHRGWLETEPHEFMLRVPFVEGVPLYAQLIASRLQGRLQVDGPGMRIQDAVLSGYATRDSILQLIADLKAACAGEDPARGFCALVGGLIAERTPEEVLDEFLLGLLGGFDVRLENGFPYPCASEEEINDCNAASVCARLQTAGVEIRGVATPP